MFVKDVDLEAMPTSIFLNDDDDDDDDCMLDERHYLHHDTNSRRRVDGRPTAHAIRRT